MNVRICKKSWFVETIALEAQENKRSIARAIVDFYKNVRDLDIECWHLDVSKVDNEWTATITSGHEV